MEKNYRGKPHEHTMETTTVGSHTEPWEATRQWIEPKCLWNEPMMMMIMVIMVMMMMIIIMTIATVEPPK